MDEQIHNKLVRDHIPDIIEAQGGRAVTRILGEDEMADALDQKLDEEVAEFHANPSIEELIDIEEVILTRAALMGYNWRKVQELRLKKQAKRGGFDKRIFLESVESDLRQVTIDTYNQSAKELAEFFRGIGPRQQNIDYALGLVDKPAAECRVLEIGCGDGRDAQVITSRTGWYMGFDVSEEAIKIARQDRRDINFQVGDAVTFEFPDKIDVIFAFASLLHLNPKELQTVFSKAYKSLNPGGIFYVSTKWAPKYTRQIKEDEFGTRLFHLYDDSNIAAAAEHFEIISSEHKTIGNTEWLEVALRKP